MATPYSTTLSGAAAVVFSHDHCPPHVTIRHRSDGWVARVRFSFVTNDVDLMDVEPQRRAPRLGSISRLLDEVQDRLEESRQCWWAVHSTACLDNRWFQLEQAGSSPLTLLSKRRPGARQLEACSYDAKTLELSLRFYEGSTLIIKAGLGDEQ